MNDSLDILFEDNNIAVIKKPRGLAVQTGKSFEKDAVSMLKQHLKSDNPSIKGEPYVGVIHRLDQPVEGIVVFAKNSKAAAALSAQVQSDVMNKHYIAEVEGILPDNGATELRNRIYKSPKTKMAVIVDDMAEKVPEGVSVKDAILTYNVIEVHENSSVVEISLKTGRFHQIRAQFSNLGHPIIGDGKYGSPRKFTGGIALCADSLTFRHPVTGKEMKFEIACDFAQQR